MPHSPNKLDSDRLKVLKQIAAGKSVKLERRRMYWFREHGYLTLGARPKPNSGPPKRGAVMRSYELTDKARQAIAAAAGDASVSG